MELIRSVDGYSLVNTNERGVYWPHMDYTDVYDARTFLGIESIRADESGGAIVQPELVMPR